MSSPEELADALIVGDPSAIDGAIVYLERDPWEFRSGYAKATLMRRLKQVALTDAQAVRLERVLLRYVDVGSRWDFREACVLARRLDMQSHAPSLRAGLRTRLRTSEVGVALRALTMMLTLQRPDLTASETEAARGLLLRWAAERDDPRYLRPSQSIERAVRQLWSPQWAQELHHHAAASADDPLRHAARRLLKVAPHRARR